MHGRAVIFLYVKGLSERDIEEELREIYKFNLSESTIFNITARGVEDILITCTNNLIGFMQGIKSIFPRLLLRFAWYIRSGIPPAK